jgi:hypothetical protein
VYLDAVDLGLVLEILVHNAIAASRDSVAGNERIATLAVEVDLQSVAIRNTLPAGLPAAALASDIENWVRDGNFDASGSGRRAGVGARLAHDLLTRNRALAFRATPDGAGLCQVLSWASVDEENVEP